MSKIQLWKPVLKEGPAPTHQALPQNLPPSPSCAPPQPALPNGLSLRPGWDKRWGCSWVGQVGEAQARAQEHPRRQPRPILGSGNAWILFPQLPPQPIKRSPLRRGHKTSET